MNTTTQNIEIFLGKSGQTFGPYSIEQFETIKSSPEYRSYTYIWDGRESNAQWKPLEAGAPQSGPGAPPPDGHPGSSSVVAPPAPAPARSAQVALRGYDAPGIEVLCHDSRSVVGGKLTRITDSGCELVTQQGSTAQEFGSQSPVMLNLLDPKSGKSMNVAARLGGVRREEKTWSYRVLWQECPELIIQLLEKSA